MNHLGQLCGCDLVSSDAAGALAFYQALFGRSWQVTAPQAAELDAPACWTVASNDRSWLTVTELAVQLSPARWHACIAVDDIDIAVDTVIANEGSLIVPPLARSCGPRTAIIADPVGAELGLRELSKPYLANSRRGHGEPAALVRWSATNTGHEIHSFYEQLLGWRSDGHRMVGAQPTTELHATPATLEHELPCSTWLCLLGCDDLNAAIHQALAHDGEVLLEGARLSHGEPWCLVRDAQGGLIGLTTTS